MADDGSQQDAVWPMPQFRFSVDFEDDIANIAFQEVSGLDTEAQIIEYRHSDSSVLKPVKMSGTVKYGNVTMKRGICVNDNKFWDWYSEIKMNTIKRRKVVIRLLDEAGKVTMTWTLENAWPTKITSTDLKSEGNEVAIETLELAHENLTVS